MGVVQETELVLLMSRIQIVQGVAITIGHPMRNPDYCNALTFASLTAFGGSLGNGWLSFVKKSTTRVDRAF